VLIISLIVSVFSSVIASQGAYAIPSEYLTDGGFETSKFSGLRVTNLGFDHSIINDGKFDHSDLTNSKISLLGTLDALSIQEQGIDNKTIKEQVIDNNIYKVWSDTTSPGNSEILLAISTDGGNSFTNPKNISNNTGTSENPALAVSGNTVYVVWSDNTSGNSEILFIKSTDAGANFTDPDNISNNAGTSENPAIEVSGNTVYITWPDIVSGNSPDCSTAEPSQSRLWPPNRNIMESINIIGVTDPDGDNVSINMDRITQDEPTKLNPGDQFYPDGKGIGTNTAQIRSERDGNGDGRVYEISFTASDSSGATCSDSVFVGVPRNQNSDPMDSGQRYDSTLPDQLIDNNINNVRSDNTSGNSEILFIKSTDAGANFTDPDNISNNAGSSENPAIEVSENTIYVVWSNSASNSEILFIKSTDAGANFTDPENISNSEGTSENPVIAVSGNSIYVVWIDTTSGNNQVPIAVSENGGENFSAPIIISNNAGDISNPQILISGDNVSITWIDNSSGTNKILLAESTNGGNSFSAPKTVSNNPNVYVTWLEDNGNTGEMDVFIAVSNDNGTSFNNQTLSIADPNGPTSAAHISNPVVFGNNVYVTWIEDENASTEEEDVFIAVSNNDGQTFNITRLSIADPNGPTAAFDINEPVVSGDNVYVTWAEDEDPITNYKDTFIAVSNDNGASFNTQKLSIADPNGPTSVNAIGLSKPPVVSGNNVYVTWTEDEDSTTFEKDAFIAVSNDNGASFNITRLSIADPNGPTYANYINKPIVSGDNVYVTWTEDEDANTNYVDLFIAVSNDNGQTFDTTKLSIADPNGPTEVLDIDNLDLLPVVYGSNVYVTWLEEEDANNEVGDAFIAVSNDNGLTFDTIGLSILDPNGPTNADHMNNPVVSGANIYVTWIEYNATKNEKDAFIAVSNNTGQTFDTKSLSITDPDGPTDIDQDFPISSPRVSGSNVYVTWNEQPDTLTGEVPFISVSNNTGQTFKTINLSIIEPGEGSSSNFPINSPVVSGSGVYVTWIERELDIERERDAFIGVSNDNGQTFNTTRLSKIDPDGGTRANNIMNDPVVSGDNIYVTWREDKNKDTDLNNAFIAVSNDNGASFSTKGLSIFDQESLGNVRSIGDPVVP
jgi:hypothetical protein